MSKMGYNEKTRIINELLDNLRKGVLEKVDQMPDHWDGVELSWFVSDYFDYHFAPVRSHDRRVNYRTVCLNQDLI